MVFQENQCSNTNECYENSNTQQVRDAPTRIAAPSRNYRPDEYLPRMKLDGGRKQFYEETTTTLPSGAKRKMIPHPKKKGEFIAEEISVPPRISKRHSREVKELVSIDVLDEWAKSAFQREAIEQTSICIV